MSKRVIFIHGLDSKPPKDDLFELWKKCLFKNIELYDSSYNIDSTKFSMVYWANNIPNHLEDKTSSVDDAKNNVTNMLNLRETMGNDLHNGKGSIIGLFFKDKAMDLASMLTGALSIKDNILRKALQEVRFYQNDQYIADKIRFDLEQEMINAWNNNEEISIISHSMGTFIAYDVLWRFSRKNTAMYSPYKNKKIPLFITMGCPLGESAIQELLLGDAHEDERQFPSNIQKWYNFSALGDVVSHDSALDDDFHKKMKSKNLLDASTDYINLQNIYKKSNGKLNPHKSYGYLIQPKLAKILLKFLKN